MSGEDGSADISDEVEAWMTGLSNWGRWGTDDERGTLNLITDEHRRRAAGLVREGITVSCAHDIVTGTVNAQRYMVATGLDRDECGAHARPGASDGGRSSVAAEYLGMIFHGMTITHLDAPSHVFWNGLMYNGAPASLVTDRHGATRSDVRAVSQGVATRGVLLDVAALLGVDPMEPGTPITPAHLDEASERAGIRVGPGDVLLVRTGEAARRSRAGMTYTGSHQPGLHASCLPWLRERDVALLGSDVAQDVRPTGVARFSMPIHTVGLVAMGLWLIDNCDLDPLAAMCNRLRRWEFSFVLAPLRFRGATGSPCNPLAIF